MHKKINNEIYETSGNSWWDDDASGTLASLRYLVNETRLNYFNSVLSYLSLPNTHNVTLLDVGCGGGFLSEEFARNGLKVTGIDPSKETIICAQQHAQNNNLVIDYFQGYGENLPFNSNSFSIVACFDVFEHVSELDKVIKEISRVLIPGGILFFETINRTLVGKLILKATQEWKSTAFMDHNIHIFDMFIKPKELSELFRVNNLIPKEFKGIVPGINFFTAYMALRKCKHGEMSFQELGKKLNMKISNDTKGQYIGYAMKSPS